MDVRLPDGTVVRNVPEGMTQAELLRRLGRAPAQSAETEPPAYEEGPVEAAMIGAGKTATRIGQGMQQAYYGLTGNTAEQERLKAEVDDENQRYAPLAQRRPLATGIGEALPAMAMPVGAGGAAATVLRGALAGFLPEFMQYGSAEDRLKRGVVGGLGGGIGAGAAVGGAKLLQPFKGGVGVSDDALAAASRIGFKPTPAQVSQNPALQNVENRFARSLGSSGRIKGVYDTQQVALNKAGARAMGETSDDLSEAVFAGAKNRLGTEFERLQSMTMPDAATPDFMKSIIAVNNANLSRGPFASGGVDNLVDKALDLASQGKLSGQAYKEIHTELARESSKAFKSGDATLGQAYKTIRLALDDAAKQSLPQAEQAAWANVRKQWEAFKILTKGNVSEGGNVSAARVAAAVRQRGPQLRTGELSGDVADIARIGEAFKGPQNPNSGNLLQGGWMSIPLAAANNVGARAYTAPAMQRYLTQGLVDMTPEKKALMQALMRPAGLLGTSAFLGAE